MKKQITVKLTNAQLEIAVRVLTAVRDVMTWDENLCEWIADYESFILSLNDDEIADLNGALGKL